MERTLYLTEKKGLVVLRDGPSLWIKSAGQAGIRVPARLLDLVYVVGNIRMDAGIVALFSEHNIPVTFMNSKGDAVCVALPYRAEEPDHAETQRRFLRRERAADRFQGWFRSRKRQAQLFALRRLEGASAGHLSREGFRDLDYCELIDRRTKGRERRFKAARAIIANLLRELIVRRITNAGMDPHLGILNRRTSFGLATDLSQVLNSEADMQALMFLDSATDGAFFPPGPEGASVSKEGFREIVGRFEARKRSLVTHLDTLLDSLLELMKQTAE